MKKMKKSMFITTLMMVVLLVVALSTSTFAWFSANNTVAANQATMTAATSSDANITIGWSGTGNMYSSITFNNENEFQPAIPKFLPSVIGYTAEAQYVATNVDVAAGESYDFEYLEHGTVPNINVIFADTANLIAQADATIDNYPGLVNALGTELAGDETAPLLTRIYRTQYAKAQYYRMTTVTVAADLITKFEISEATYDYLTIVANGAKIQDNDIEIDDIASEYGNIYAGTDAGLDNALTPVAGNRIYNMKEVFDIHKIVGINEDPGSFIAGGIDGLITAPGAIDFVTVTTAAGFVDTEVDGEYYINEADAQDIGGVFKCVDAKAGDKIYNVCEVKAIPRTTHENFVGLGEGNQNGLYTSTIDNDYRFKSNGEKAGSVLKTLKGRDPGADSDGDTFYIRNNNAPGTAPATLSMTATIEGAGDTLVRFAIFVKNPGDNAFNYIGTMVAAAEADTYYGTIVEGAFSTDLPKYTTTGASLPAFTQIDPNRSVEMKVVAWFDGVALGTQESGRETNVVFNFSATM